MSLLRGIFWVVLFVFFTFCFVVLFEYGTHDFTNGFQKEFSRVKTFVMKQVSKKEKPKKYSPLLTRRIRFRPDCRCSPRGVRRPEICGSQRARSRRNHEYSRSRTCR